VFFSAFVNVEGGIIRPPDVNSLDCEEYFSVFGVDPEFLCFAKILSSAASCNTTLAARVAVTAGISVDRPASIIPLLSTLRHAITVLVPREAREARALPAVGDSRSTSRCAMFVNAMPAKIGTSDSNGGIAVSGKSKV
jgi:hypothetical protein